jgi:hypothetical protein
MVLDGGTGAGQDIDVLGTSQITSKTTLSVQNLNPGGSSIQVVLSGGTATWQAADAVTLSAATMLVDGSGAFALTADSDVSGAGTLSIATVISVNPASTVTDVFLTGADLVLSGSLTATPASVTIQPSATAGSTIRCVFGACIFLLSSSDMMLCCLFV